MIFNESNPFYQFWDFIKSLLVSLNTSDPFLRTAKEWPLWRAKAKWRLGEVTFRSDAYSLMNAHNCSP